jgi:hypothetical protein
MISIGISALVGEKDAVYHDLERVQGMRPAVIDNI